jgi:hypothetical protein
MDDDHTETEARRLFAAAAETIPPGHDLIDGVRRRRARNRLRARAAIGAGSAAAVAAGALLSVTATGAPSALAAVTSAVAKTASESYRVSMISTETGKPKFSFESTGPVRTTGEFDPARQIGEEISTGERDLYIDGYVYWTVPPGEKSVDGKPWVMARSGLTRPPARTPTIRRRASSSRLPLGLPIYEAALSGTDIPQTLLTLLKSASTVRDEGPVSGPGWTGTRYSFSMRNATGPYPIVHGTVDVDQQGRVRQLIATRVFREDYSSVTGIHSATDDITFSDFGLRVSVTAPPASQVYKEPGGGGIIILGSS